MGPCHNGSVRRAGMAIGRRAQQWIPQPHPPILRIRYIRGIGRWGWGVWGWVVYQARPFFARRPLPTLSTREKGSSKGQV